MASQYSTWEGFFSESSKPMYAYAYRLTRRNADYADDLVQETIVKILRSGCEIGELKKPPLAYVYRTMLHAWIDHLRKVRRAQTESLDVAVLRKDFPFFNPVVQREFENKELLETIIPKIGPLSSAERTLLKLKSEGLDCDAISKILNEDVRITRANYNALKAKLRYRWKKNQ